MVNIVVCFDMNSSIYLVLNMHFAERLVTFRKERKLTQQGLGNMIGLTKAQIYRYEKGISQPSLRIIKKLSLALTITADQLLFDQSERELPSNLHQQFEAVTRMTDEDQRAIETLIEGMISKYRTRELVGDIRR